MEFWIWWTFWTKFWVRTKTHQKRNNAIANAEMASILTAFVEACIIYHFLIDLRRKVIKSIGNFMLILFHDIGIERVSSVVCYENK